MSDWTLQCSGPNCRERAPECETYCSKRCERNAGLRYVLRDALATAGYIDPDDGTVPMWPHGDRFPHGPVWVPAWRLCDAVIANWPEWANGGAA